MLQQRQVTHCPLDCSSLPTTWPTVNQQSSKSHHKYTLVNQALPPPGMMASAPRNTTIHPSCCNLPTAAGSSATPLGRRSCRLGHRQRPDPVLSLSHHLPLPPPLHLVAQKKLRIASQSLLRGTARAGMSGPQLTMRPSQDTEVSSGSYGCQLQSRTRPW